MTRSAGFRQHPDFLALVTCSAALVRRSRAARFSSAEARRPRCHQCPRVLCCRRFGYCEVIDFLAFLFGYAISGERILEAFYKRLHLWTMAFMALFGRERLPSRSASRAGSPHWTRPPSRCCAPCSAPISWLAS